MAAGQWGHWAPNICRSESPYPRSALVIAPSTLAPLPAAAGPQSGRGSPGQPGGLAAAAAPSESRSRPPYSWLADLERLRDAAASGARPKVSILDVADRLAEPGCTAAACMPTSPRSVDACLRLGIDPASLAPRPLAAFLRQERSPELAQLAFEHEERLRQDRLKALIEERRRLVEGGARSRGKVRGGGARVGLGGKHSWSDHTVGPSSGWAS